MSKTHPHISQERILLLLATAFVLTNQIMLIIVQERSWLDLWQSGVWMGCAAILHLALNRQLPQRDPYLLPTMLLLIGWGLTTIDRLEAPFADRQALWLIISTAALLVITHLPSNLRWFSDYAYHWLALGLLSLFATLVIGVNPSGIGPRLWLGLGTSIYYQPSEFLKIIFVAFLAAYLSQQHLSLIRSPFSWRFLLPTSIVLSICLTILLIQRDLGTASIYFILYVLMLYLTTGRWLYLMGGIALTIIAVIVAYSVYDVVTLRIDVWLNPWPEAENRAFQIVQSLMAVSAGRVLGVGVGQGLPNFIPVVHSDFVFAAIAEEWGLVGILSLLGTILVLVLRGMRLAMHSSAYSFFALLSAGISLLFAIQSLIIIGGTLRLWPLTGVTLPFVSYGGSSLLTSVVAVGVLILISQQQS